MPRKRQVNMSVEEITNEIASIDTQIESLTSQVKDLKAAKKKLAKDFITAKKQEDEAAKVKQMEELVNLIQEKGLTVEQVKEILDK